MGDITKYLVHDPIPKRKHKTVILQKKINYKNKLKLI